MDRLGKVNLLLEIEELNNIWTSLSMCHGIDPSTLLKEYEQKSNFESPQSLLKQSWRDEIEQIYQERAIFRQRGFDTKLLDEKIVNLKRSLRQGIQLNEGEILDDRYRLLEICGRGGFAKVWQAYDRDSRQLVAIKVLHSDQAEDPRHVERFSRGARLLRSLNHTSIIRIFADPAIDAGFVHYVMEYLAGGDFHQAVTDGYLTLRKSLGIILEIGKALEYMHSFGLIHRDVKPQNILLDGAGGVRLTDFDLIWASDTTGGTRTGGLGTFVYAAPEAMEDASRVDPRADVFSLSMTAVFAIFGRKLPRQALQHSSRFLRSIDCPNAIKLVLQRGIAWEPRHRYPSIVELCTALEAAMSCTFDIIPVSSYKGTSRTSAGLLKTQPIFRIAEEDLNQRKGLSRSGKRKINLIAILISAAVLIIPSVLIQKDGNLIVDPYGGNSSDPTKLDKQTIVPDAPRESRNTHEILPRSRKVEKLEPSKMAKKTAPLSALNGPRAIPLVDDSNMQHLTRGAVTEQTNITPTSVAEAWRLNQEKPLAIEVYSSSVKSQYQITIFDTYNICVAKGGWVESNSLKFIAGDSSRLQDLTEIRSSTCSHIYSDWKYDPHVPRFCYQPKIKISVTYVPMR